MTKVYYSESEVDDYQRGINCDDDYYYPMMEKVIASLSKKEEAFRTCDCYFINISNIDTYSEGVPEKIKTVINRLPMEDIYIQLRYQFGREFAYLREYANIKSSLDRRIFYGIPPKWILASIFATLEDKYSGGIFRFRRNLFSRSIFKINCHIRDAIMVKYELSRHAGSYTFGIMINGYISFVNEYPQTVKDVCIRTLYRNKLCEKGYDTLIEYAFLVKRKSSGLLWKFGMHLSYRALTDSWGETVTFLDFVVITISNNNERNKIKKKYYFRVYDHEICYIILFNYYVRLFAEDIIEYIDPIEYHDIDCRIQMLEYYDNFQVIIGHKVLSVNKLFLV
jgi:hypothetical protein